MKRRAAGPVCVLLLAAVMVSLGSRPVVAQAEYSGPGVVPPAAAYLDDGSGPEVGSVHRWHIENDRMRRLRVFLSPPPEGRPSFWETTERALEEWTDISGLPFAFDVTRRADKADVRFEWIRRFEGSRAGTTDWRADGEGWLEAAVVTLAIEHGDALPMSDEFLFLVALHEIGHVLGLPHSENPGDVMHPGNRNRDLSARDVLSIRRLYESPAGEPVEIQ